MWIFIKFDSNLILSSNRANHDPLECNNNEIYGYFMHHNPIIAPFGVFRKRWWTWLWKWLRYFTPHTNKCWVPFNYHNIFITVRLWKLIRSSWDSRLFNLDIVWFVWIFIYVFRLLQSEISREGYAWQNKIIFDRSKRWHFNWSRMWNDAAKNSFKTENINSIYIKQQILLKMPTQNNFFPQYRKNSMQNFRRVVIHFILFCYTISQAFQNMDWLWMNRFFVFWSHEKLISFHFAYKENKIIYAQCVGVY